MNTLRTALCIASLAAGVLAQQPPAATPAPDATIGRLEQTAEKQLAASNDELNALRTQVGAEKLPLAQELTATEDQLLKLRRQHDDATRSVDSGNLEIATLKGEIKARQDELDYVGNLLDEYARTFETTVNVCELQSCGEALVAAKEAPENPTLSMTDKFERQTAFAGLTLKRISDCVDGLRFPGVGVDSQGTVQSGQFAIVGPVALFRASTGLAGLAVPQTGSDKPLIRPLEGQLGVGLGALVETGEGLLPLDPSRGGALKALVAKTNLIHIFSKGGPIMWPLLCASILALGTVLERLVFLVNERRKRDAAALGRLFQEVEQGDTDAAIRVGQGSQDYVVRSLAYALQHRETSLPNALFHAQQQELRRFRRGIPILDTIITLAPLLGLLGTVTGMMASFSLISGELSAPGAITGGIAEALIATAFGLGIAITSLIPFNFLNSKLEEARHEIESAATQLELIVQRQVAAVPLTAPILTRPLAPAAPSRRLVGKE